MTTAAIVNPFAKLKEQRQTPAAPPVVNPVEIVPPEAPATVAPVATAEPATAPVATAPAEPEVTATPRNTTTPRGSKSPTTRRQEPLYFDLETIPDWSRVDLFGLDPLPEEIAETPIDELPPTGEFLAMPLADAAKKIDGILPHAEWLKTIELQEKAAAKPRKGMFDLIDKARGLKDAAARAKEERIKLLSVTPEYCSIAALGYAIGSDNPVAMVVGQDKGDGTGEKITERDILEKFWQLVATCSPLIGFNVLGFDLPVIFVRSYLLDVAPCKKIDLTPWKDDVIDLMVRRWPRGGQKGLKDIARILGIPVPAGDCDGSKVNDLMTAGEIDKVAEYVRSDIVVTQKLHRSYRGFWC